jgi:hypothetical protein
VKLIYFVLVSRFQIILVLGQADSLVTNSPTAVHVTTVMIRDSVRHQACLPSQVCMPAVSKCSLNKQRIVAVFSWVCSAVEVSQSQISFNVHVAQVRLSRHYRLLVYHVHPCIARTHVYGINLPPKADDYILNEFRYVTCCCLLEYDAFDKLVPPFRRNMLLTSSRQKNQL